MKIALCQINPTVGDFEGNTNKILAITKKHKSDLFVFPELSVCGYCPQDLILDRNFVGKNIEALNRLAKQCQKATIVGFVDQKNAQRYNAAAFIHQNTIKFRYHKQQLPNYSVFDEKRWFSAGNDNSIFIFKNKKIALNICEDIWPKDVCEEQDKSNPDFFINISASPYSSTKIEQIENILLQRYQETKKPIVYVNQVGGQDGLVYYGHSMYVDKGKIIAKAKDFEEDIVIVDI